MEHFQYKRNRYEVQAKRKDSTEEWTDWTIVNDYDVAVRHAKRAEELGFCTRIIDKGEKPNEQ